mmetsp:Transcript_7186/g.15371  ORF Transcript_7186/g.15371 Transcript_7186/m.15371 type:complete len:90 (-) Transcript_7186:541-810(-)
MEEEITYEYNENFTLRPQIGDSSCRTAAVGGWSLRDAWRRARGKKKLVSSRSSILLRSSKESLAESKKLPRNSIGLPSVFENRSTTSSK